MKTPTLRQIAVASIPLLVVVLVNLVFQYALFSKALNWVRVQSECVESTHRCALLDRAAHSISKPLEAPPSGEATLAPKFRDIAVKFSSWTTWAIFATLFFFVCVGCFFLGFSLTQRLKTPGLLGLLAVAAAATLGFFWRFPNQHLPVLQYLFPYTIGRDAPQMLPCSIFLSSLGYAATAVLVLTGCFLLLPPRETGPDTMRKALEDRIAQADMLLYFSVALLIASMMVVNSIYAWVSVYVVADPVAREASDNMVKSVMTGSGAYYTLIAAGLYLPITIFLRLRLKNLDDSETSLGETTDPSSFVSPSAFQALLRVLVILAPLLAGPVGDLIGKLGGH